MLLTEEHRIKACNNKELFRQIDGYCYRAKNLSNAVKYLVKQCYRIHTKLRKGESLEEWEREMADSVNSGIRRYNTGRAAGKQLRHIDESNGYIADAYFLSWYLKGTEEYKAMPYATCSQICIQEKCREWKSFYRAKAAYGKDRGGFTGCPHAPGYLDRTKGRGWLAITSQNFRADDCGNVTMPGFLKGIHIRIRHRAARQIRVRACRDEIVILVVYEEKEKQAAGTKTVMGIDLGVNNLAAVAWNSCQPPMLLNGRPLKSVNQYYNKQ